MQVGVGPVGPVGPYLFIYLLCLLVREVIQTLRCCARGVGWHVVAI